MTQRRPLLAAIAALVLAACTGAAPAAAPAAAPPPSSAATAVFAGGCFWCVEHDMAKIPGVIDVVSGYAGGQNDNPTYENHPGHYEVVQVTYDPARLSYRQLVDAFWPLVDPTDPGGQFCDRGASYRTAIFATDAQRADAEASLAALAASGRLQAPVVTPILPAARFWEAEGYHQNYAAENPLRYRLYRTGCGRDARLREVWGR